MAITPSYLQKNLHMILDKVLETGIAATIMWKGQTLNIVADRKPDVFARLQKHPTIVQSNTEDIVHMDWSCYWCHELP